MAIKDLIVLNETDSKLEAQQGTDTARIKGTSRTVLDIVSDDEVSVLKVNSSGSEVVMGGPVTMSGDISGSLPTASMGHAKAAVFTGDGSELTGIITPDTVSSSLQLADVISGSWQTELSSSDLVFVDGGISGSGVSTGSFGRFIAVDTFAGEGTQLSNVPFNGIVSSSTQIGQDTSGSFLGQLSGTAPAQTFIGGGVSASLNSSSSLHSVVASFEGDASQLTGMDLPHGLISSSAQLPDVSGSYVGLFVSGSVIELNKGLKAAGSGGVSGSNAGPGGQKAIFSGFNNNEIQHVTISTLGDTADFGDLTETLRYGGVISNGSNDRGIIAGDYPSTNTINYVTISINANAQDFGDLGSFNNDSRHGAKNSISNGTNERGIFTGGVYPNYGADIHQFITISTLGNAKLFGNLETTMFNIGAHGTSNQTNERGIIDVRQVMEYITISTLGDSAFFGNHLEDGTTGGFGRIGHTSNGTDNRAVRGGTNSTTIAYHTLATNSDSLDFGDFTETFGTGNTATSNTTDQRGLFTQGNSTDTMNYLTINTLANALDFGNFEAGYGGHMAASNAGATQHVSELSEITSSTFVGDGAGLTFDLPLGAVSSSRDIGHHVSNSLHSPMGVAVNNLVAWWEMGENIEISGTVGDPQAKVIRVFDSSGNGNHLIASGSISGSNIVTSYTPSGSTYHNNYTGSYRALEFDRTDQFLQTEKPFDVFLKPQFTISFWFRGNLGGYTQQQVFFQNGVMDINAYANYFNTTVHGITLQSQQVTGISYPKWQHFVITCDRDTRQINLHGNNQGNVASASIEGQAPTGKYYHGTNQSGSTLYDRYWPQNDDPTPIYGNAANPFRIGANATLSKLITGSFDDIAIYDKVLSLEEITTLYNYGTGSHPNAISSSHMDSVQTEMFVGGGVTTGYSFNNSLSSSAGGDRVLIAGGTNSSDTDTDTIEHITVSTPGNAIDFGNRTEGKYNISALSNGLRQRGLFAGGFDGSDGSNVIDFVTIDTTGNATDFGDLTAAGYAGDGMSNGPDDRGVIIVGEANGDALDFVTISTAGNAVAFGNTLSSAARTAGATDNATNQRGIIAGGTPAQDVIEFITISTLGGGSQFGDLSQNTTGAKGHSNKQNERAVFAGGATNTIEFVTMNVLGNSVDFGDMTQLKTSEDQTAGSSNAINERGIMVASTTTAHSIENITISTPSNALIFGSLAEAREATAATSNATPTRTINSSFPEITADRVSGVGTAITNHVPANLVTSSAQLASEISGSVGRFESTYSPYSVEMYQGTATGSTDMPFTASAAMKNERSVRFNNNGSIGITGSLMAPMSESQTWTWSHWLRQTKNTFENSTDNVIQEYNHTMNSNYYNGIWRLRQNSHLFRVITPKFDDSGTDTVSLDFTNEKTFLRTFGYQWNHHVVTYEQSSSKVVDAVSGSTPHLYSMYLNGNLMTTRSVSLEYRHPMGISASHSDRDPGRDGPIRIGERSPAGSNWQGYFNHSAYWDTALSASALRYLWNAGIAADPLVNSPSYNAAANLVGYYRYGDTQNGVSASHDGSAWHFGNLASGSGNGYENTWASASFQGTSDSSNRIDFDAPPKNDRFLTARYPEALSGSQDATIAFWARTGTTGKKVEYLIGNAAEQGFEIRKGGDDANFRFAVLTGSSAHATSSFETHHAIPDNNSEGTSSGFAHYALTYDGDGALTGYVQGSGSALTRTGTATASLSFDTGSFKFADTAGTGILNIGRKSRHSGSTWLGSIHEVAIWTSSLSADAIADLAKGPFDLGTKTTTNYNATSSLVTYFSMTSGSFNGGS